MRPKRNDVRTVDVNEEISCLVDSSNHDAYRYGTADCICGGTDDGDVKFMLWKTCRPLAGVLLMGE